MSAGFDWTGAPEGERYRRNYGSSQGWEYYVIKVRDEVVFWSWADQAWSESSYTAEELRLILGFERVESARPELRDEVVRPPVRVGDRVRITVAGTVVGNEYSSKRGLLTVQMDALQQHVHPSDVEVLTPADPPLEPGDLVRDREGAVWQYARTTATGPEFGKVNDCDGGPASLVGLAISREDIPGPLVKVKLVDVSDD